jgi:formamidopyrimidine-DNA glycosylase
MPELPEVETTARGIRPHVVGKRIADVVVRDARLRWRVPATLAGHLRGNRFESVERRAKYLLLRAHDGSVLVHLGMSGSLRILPAATPHRKHDHIDIVFDDGTCLRLRDPRRFGAMLWCDGDCHDHKLLRDLGPEPLSDGFDGATLFERSRGRKVAVKLFLMDAHTVVGVGNIYANEALFRAGIRPGRAAGRVNRAEYDTLAKMIKQVLADAIEQGGTTLRDYVRSTGDLGYFQLKLNVYGKAEEPCPRCGQPVRHIRQGQRSTFYCARCQR